MAFGVGTKDCEGGSFSNWFPDLKPNPVKKGHIFHMLGHKMKVTTVKNTGFNNERKVFLNCAPDCCTRPFHAKLEILEKDLLKVTLDKL